MNLHQLAQKFGTDKERHGYGAFYEAVLPLHGVRSLLEIGVFKGASLKMWAERLPQALIDGWDIKPCSTYGLDDRISLSRVDCRSREDLERARQNKSWDLIVDDGGHTMQQQQLALSLLFPHCEYYVLEDIHTSWHSKYFTSDDISTYTSLMELNQRGWLSKYATSAEAAYLVRNAQIIGIYLKPNALSPRSGSVVLWNRERARLGSRASQL